MPRSDDHDQGFSMHRGRKDGKGAGAILHFTEKNIVDDFHFLNCVNGHMDDVQETQACGGALGKAEEKEYAPNAILHPPCLTGISTVWTEGNGMKGNTKGDDTPIGGWSQV